MNETLLQKANLPFSILSSLSFVIFPNDAEEVITKRISTCSF